MVFLNLATKQMTVKIVYYGPGLCGKTTNLQYIYQKTSPETRGEMVSLETEADRTLFFDLLPLEVGTIGEYKTKIQLYTVPGQVFYNTTRKLVLKGVDGIVFVADSQRAMADANVESFSNLKENLKELGLRLEDIPLVFQYNKRDLPNLMTVEELNQLLNKNGYPYIEAIAVQGKGVFETLKEISKSTLKHLRKKLTEEQAAQKKVVTESKFTVREEKKPQPAETKMIPPPPAQTAQVIPPKPTATVKPPAQTKPVPPPKIEKEEKEVKVEFGTISNSHPQPTMEVRHVRVKSSIDVLGELEKLRRQSSLEPLPAKPKKKESIKELDELLLSSADQRKEIHKNFELPLEKSKLQNSSEVHITLQLFDSNNKEIITLKNMVIPLKDVRLIKQLLLNLKIDLQGK